SELELRLFRPAHRDGADGQPRGPLPGTRAPLERRGHGSHERQGRERLRPAAVPRGLGNVDAQAWTSRPRPRTRPWMMRSRPATWPLRVRNTTASAASSTRFLLTTREPPAVGIA